MQQGLLQLVLLLLTLHVTPISSEMLKTIKQVMARPQKHWVRAAMPPPPPTTTTPPPHRACRRR